MAAVPHGTAVRQFESHQNQAVMNDCISARLIRSFLTPVGQEVTFTDFLTDAGNSVFAANFYELELADGTRRAQPARCNRFSGSR